MNAAEQAKGVQLATKIAAIVNLFKNEFPDARADLKPWRNDPDTREWIDPDSIDLGFHFPGWSPKLQGRSLLVQIRFHQDSVDGSRRLIGVEIAAFNHEGEAWRLSTVERWQIVGNYQPAPITVDKLKHFCLKLFELFQTL
ncbi:hypothetical protein [Oscillatoria sp. FACHB-1406]|uniref:hypothetical protein n=1 Tax=Oscillatoria sp. FACHB-1406 TaxID=2692846 RepID=UPI00168916C0|nr:hypothetical protein [Oscillatoria sp. FACHB-1406]